MRLNHLRIKHKLEPSCFWRLLKQTANTEKYHFDIIHVDGICEKSNFSPILNHKGGWNGGERQCIGLRVLKSLHSWKWCRNMWWSCVLHCYSRKWMELSHRGISQGSESTSDHVALTTSTAVEMYHYMAAIQRQSSPWMQRCTYHGYQGAARGPRERGSPVLVGVIPFFIRHLTSQAQKIDPWI